MSDVSAAVLCCDCKDLNRIKSVLKGRKVNLVVTSPPYASQREYDTSSGFVPIAPERYVDWYKDVAAVIAEILAPDGSYFLNIKEHAQDGERSLYVKDLVIAHKREWGWRFVDEFCWRKTDNGVPGWWNNRFKNAWEPVHHFCLQPQIKFRPEAVSHASDDVFDYSPENPKSTSGSGLLGSGPRERHEGMARPSNVIEVRTESNQGSHSAPFPRALVEFFVKEFSDPGDIVFDPFGGSGTTAVAALGLGRNAICTEISPQYCDVIVRRVLNAQATFDARLAGDGRTFDEIAAERQGVAA